MKRITLITLVGLMNLGAATHLAATTMPELTPERETAMAFSAAPEHLRAGASVFLMGAGGLKRVKQGTNDFSCMVQREGPVLAPTCFDQEGSRTTLLANMRKVQLRAAGKNPKAIKTIIAAE